MSDFLKRIMDEMISRYGIFAILSIVIAFFGIWGAIHMISEPGKEISILGIIRYSKPQQKMKISRDELEQIILSSTKDLFKKTKEKIYLIKPHLVKNIKLVKSESFAFYSEALSKEFTNEYYEQFRDSFEKNPKEFQKVLSIITKRVNEETQNLLYELDRLYFELENAIISNADRDDLHIDEYLIMIDEAVDDLISNWKISKRFSKSRDEPRDKFIDMIKKVRSRLRRMI